MAVLGGDYTGCSILIYDERGNHLGNTTVTLYDKRSLRAEVRDIPPSLKTGDKCGLLILSTPTPCEYQGRIIKDSRRSAIAMFLGKEHENRTCARYKVKCPAVIENFITENKSYPLLSPIEVEVINISKSGLRFTARSYTLVDGDKFQIRVVVSGNEKVLIVEAVNHLDKDDGITDYGCRFLISM